MATDLKLVTEKHRAKTEETRFIKAEEAKAEEAAKAAEAPETPKEPEKPKFELDVQEYLLNGYATYEFKKKLISYKLRTLTQEEAIEILGKAANAAIASKAHAEAILTAYSVGAVMMEVNGEKLAARNTYKTLEEFLDARFQYAKNLGVIMLDIMNADYAWLNLNVQEALREPTEQLKN